MCLLGRFIFVFERFQYFFLLRENGDDAGDEAYNGNTINDYFYIAIAGFANIVLSNYLYGCLAFGYQ